MTITYQRAIVKGHMADLVSTRAMFTAELNITSGADYRALWEDYLDAIFTPAKPLLALTTTIESLELQTFESPHWVTLSEEPYTQDGTGTQQAVANEVAIVLIGKALGLRRMGRKFISGLTEDAVQVNTFAAGFATAVAQILAGYLATTTDVSGNTLTPGIMDKDGNFHSFVGGFVSSILGSVKRRKPGRGM